MVPLVELAVRAMQYSSYTGENVLDFFGVSGSTLIAAQQTGRRAVLMELAPLSCDVIVQRWERFSERRWCRSNDRDHGAAAQCPSTSKRPEAADPVHRDTALC
jgi:DNA modification methylase